MSDRAYDQNNCFGGKYIKSILRPKTEDGRSKQRTRLVQRVGELNTAHRPINNKYRGPTLLIN